MRPNSIKEGETTETRLFTSMISIAIGGENWRNTPFELVRKRLLVQKNVGIPEIPIKPVFNLANAPYGGVDLAVPGQDHKSRIRPPVDRQGPVQIHSGIAGEIVVIVVRLLRAACDVRGDGRKRCGPAIVFVSRLQDEVERDLCWSIDQGSEQDKEH